MEEKHCLVQQPPFDVRIFFSVQVTPLRVFGILLHVLVYVHPEYNGRYIQIGKIVNRPYM